MQLTDSYVGTKVVGAVTMTKNDFLTYIGKDNDPADDAPGFMVEYLDGGKPNHPLHKGYISWSPVDVFAKNYISIGDIAGLEPHVVRLKAERAENFDRLSKLAGYISIQDKMADPDSGVTTTLPKVEPAQLDLMKQQLQHMRALEDIFTQQLTLMIPAFGVEHEATVRIPLVKNNQFDLIGAVFSKLNLSELYRCHFTGMVGGITKDSIKVYAADGELLTDASINVVDTSVKGTVTIRGNVGSLDKVFHTTIDQYAGTVHSSVSFDDVHEIEMTVQLVNPNRRPV